jgi:hypothetical protein
MDMNMTEFFESMYDEFQHAKTINKSKIIDKLPKHLKRVAKETKLNKYGNEMTENDFVEFLKFQTRGDDYVNYEYLIKYYNLKMDDNDMIVFTEQFQFDNNIKKEALFVWGILNSIKNDEFLSKYQHIIKKDLQTKFTVNLLNNKMGVEFDLCFKDLNITVEIDEAHTDKKVIANDEIKSSMMKLNGFNLIRLDFQQIHKGTSIKGNINDLMYNNQYYKQFLTNLKSMLLNALLQKYVIVRRDYIMKLYLATRNEKLSKISKAMNKNIQDIIKYKELCQNAESIEKYEELYKNLTTVNEDYIFNNELMEKYLKLYNDDKASSDFDKLFELKAQSQSSVDKNTITFFNIAIVLDYKTYQHDELKLYLRKIGIITDYTIDIKDILISWKELSIVITESEKSFDIKKLLIQYYIEIEESYEKIINMIKTHTDAIQGTEHDYKMCMQYIINKNSKENNTKMSKLEAKLDNEEKMCKVMRTEINILNDSISYFKNKYERKQPTGKTTFDLLPIEPINEELNIKAKKISDEFDKFETPKQFASRFRKCNTAKLESIIELESDNEELIDDSDNSEVELTDDEVDL